MWNISFSFPAFQFKFAEIELRLELFRVQRYLKKEIFWISGQWTARSTTQDNKTCFRALGAQLPLMQSRGVTGLPAQRIREGQSPPPVSWIFFRNATSKPFTFQQYHFLRRNKNWRLNIGWRVVRVHWFCSWSKDECLLTVAMFSAANMTHVTRAHVFCSVFMCEASVPSWHFTGCFDAVPFFVSWSLSWFILVPLCGSVRAEQSDCLSNLSKYFFLCPGIDGSFWGPERLSVGTCCTKCTELFNFTRICDLHDTLCSLKKTPQKALANHSCLAWSKCAWCTEVSIN